MNSSMHSFARKPSIVSLRAALRKAIARGNDFIVLTWGENEIVVERTQYGWFGYGWIGRSGGADLAKEIEDEARQKFLAARRAVGV